MSKLQDSINLNNYKKLGCIGSGSNGVIYRIKDITYLNIYAAKIYNESYKSTNKSENNYTYSFMREINIISKITHPLIINLIGFSQKNFEGKCQPTIVMNYLRNGSLMNILEQSTRGNQPLQWDHTKELISIYGVASAMSFLHSNNIIHRNLTTNNILLNDDFYPVICGFSHAMYENEIENDNKIVGTPIYMSPEIWLHQKYSKKSDVYAYAILIYQILTYVLPFESLDIHEIKNKVTKGERPDVSEIPEPYKELIQQCWHQDPEKRPSFDQIVKKLETNEQFIAYSVNADEFLDFINNINHSPIIYNASLPDIMQINKTNKERDSEKDSIKDPRKDAEKEKLELEIEKLRSQNRQLTAENDQLKSYIFATKEKTTDIKFFDFEDYKEESIIGKGSTSNVRIIHKIENQKYAMKVLKNFDYKSMQRFISEGEILFKLHHPCIVRIFGFNLGSKEHAPSIILSLEPTSLESSIHNEELDEHQKNKITVEIVLGMRYIHKNNFMHRDLKPSNILLSKNKHVRISDFGLAKEEDLGSSQSKGIGNIRFMAPELFEENDSDTKYTNKVDVYSFGILLIYIVTNDYPKFSLKNVRNGVPPTLPSSMAKWISELIVRCLSLQPEKRPSFSEIFEIMKLNNFDLFNDSKNKELTSKQLSMKKDIESRVLKIEAFEFQHQDSK